jgi:hypothetical protein
MLLVITLQLNSHQLDTTQSEYNLTHYSQTRAGPINYFTTLLRAQFYTVRMPRLYKHLWIFTERKGRNRNTYDKGNGARPIDLTGTTHGIDARLLKPRGYLFDRLQSLLGSIFINSDQHRAWMWKCALHWFNLMLAVPTHCTRMEFNS